MKATEIRNIACLGGGMIGAGWVVCFALNQLNVTLYDISEAQLEAARERITRSVQTLIENGVLNQADGDNVLGRIIYTTNIKDALRNADYIQESIPENMAAKRAIVEDVEAYAPSTAIFASSTSRMKISDICAEAGHKERYIVTHPYNPPHLVPLVEIAKGPDTSTEAEQTVYEFFKLLKKEPILLKKECLGFVGNRIQAVVDREIADLVGRGVVSLEDANKAVNFGPGFRYSIMGPTLIYDLGNTTGIRGLVSNMSGSGINLLEDIANWTKRPYSRGDSYYDEIDNMRSHLPDGAGESRESAAAWRDSMLIAQLKLHGKL